MDPFKIFRSIWPVFSRTNIAPSTSTDSTLTTKPETPTESTGFPEVSSTTAHLKKKKRSKTSRHKTYSENPSNQPGIPKHVVHNFQPANILDNLVVPTNTQSQATAPLSLDTPVETSNEQECLQTDTSASIQPILLEAPAEEEFTSPRSPQLDCGILETDLPDTPKIIPLDSIEPKQTPPYRPSTPEPIFIDITPGTRDASPSGTSHIVMMPDVKLAMTYSLEKAEFTPRERSVWPIPIKDPRYNIYTGFEVKTNACDTTPIFYQATTIDEPKPDMSKYQIPLEDPRRSKYLAPHFPISIIEENDLYVPENIPSQHDPITSLPSTSASVTSYTPTPIATLTQHAQNLQLEIELSKTHQPRQEHPNAHENQDAIARRKRKLAERFKIKDSIRRQMREREEEEARRLKQAIKQQRLAKLRAMQEQKRAKERRGFGVI